MNNEKKIIKELKKLKTTPVRSEFLVSLKSDLKEYMTYYPVKEMVPAAKPSPFSIFRRAHAFKAVSLIIIIVLLFSGGGVAWASQTSLPGEALYPVKLLTENVQEAFTFDPEDKARLQTRLAQKRISEIEKILKEKGVETKGLRIAQARLKAHAAKAVRIVEQEARKGKDGQLAEVIVDELYSHRQEAKRVFENAREEIKMKQIKLRGELQAAIKIGDREQVANIRAEMVHLKELRDEAQDYKKAAVRVLKFEKERLHDELYEAKRLEEEARERVEEALETREEAFEAVEEAQEIAAMEADEALEIVEDILRGDLPILNKEQEQALDAGISEESAQSLGVEKEVIAEIEDIIDFGIADEDIESLFEDIEDFDVAGFEI